MNRIGLLAVCLLLCGVCGVTCLPGLQTDLGREPREGTTLGVSIHEPSVARTVAEGTRVRIDWSAVNLTGSPANVRIEVESRADLTRIVLADNLAVTGTSLGDSLIWDTTGLDPVEYKIRATISAGGLSDITIAEATVTIDGAPTFAFELPSADTTLTLDGSDTVAIRWSAGDPEGTATARIGIDPDTDHGSGNETYIAERTLPADEAPETLEWDGTDVDGSDADTGTYNLFALVDDEVNAFQTIEGLARITVESDDGTGPVTLEILSPDHDTEVLITPDADDTELDIEFGINDAQDLLVDLRLDPDDNHQNGNEITILAQRFIEADTETDTFAWDGTDASGELVPQGIYSLLIVASSGSGDPRTVAGSGLLYRRTAVSVLNQQIWDLSNGTWTQVEPETVPSARRDHAMVMDGIRPRFVLFGGETADGAAADTWEWDRFNPWSEIETADGPPTLTQHAMAYDLAEDRRKTVLFGGLHDGVPSDATWEWDGTEWTERDDLVTHPSARYGHAMAYDQEREKVILFGGTDGVDLFSDTWEFDGTAWIERNPAHRPAPRWGHALGYDSERPLKDENDRPVRDPQQENRLVRDPVILLFGGEVISGPSDETWQWDGDDWTQLFPSTRPSPRRGHGLAYDFIAQRMYLFGGTDGAVSNAETWFWQSEILGEDANGDEIVETINDWEQLEPPTSPPAREGFAMVFDVFLRRPLVFGGGAGLPLIAVLEPATIQQVNPGDFLTIRWRDDDPTGTAVVRLTIDDDRFPNEEIETEADEIEILAERDASGDGVRDSFVWTIPITLDPGTYFVIAYISRPDETDPDHSSVAAGTIVVEDPTNPG